MRNLSSNASRLIPTLAAALTPLLAACVATARLSTDPAPDTSVLARDIRHLASDSLEGRRAGTAGNDSAAAWIARRLEDLGVRPVTFQVAGCATNGGCGPSRLQRFVAHPAAAAHDAVQPAVPTQNVLGVIPGTDPALRGQVVVLGAHFDHLGRSTFGALDPEKGAEIRNGADDNASGTAVVLELARLLVRHPTRRSVLVVLFSAEELGLLGSQYFVDHSPVALDSIQAMINFDMVGRLRNDRLIVYGVATATEWPAIVNEANVAPAFQLSAVGDGFGPSDHASFYAKNLPVLHLFTDLHEDYHRASDEADRINVPGTARVAAFAERLARSVADRASRLTFTRAPVTATSQPGSRSGSQAYLGTIPDMGASDVKGLRITGVRAGSPADSAGLKAGDVIVELGGVTVTDLYTYSDALYARQPGETVELVFVRGPARQTVKVTLGRRGG